MTTGRTIWQAQDADWWLRERVVMLGQEFGAEGPAVANWLECQAKKQNAGGVVKAGYAAIAHGAFIDGPNGSAARAEEIVNYAVEIGFLKDFEAHTRTFTARISAYHADQARGRDAFKKADSRAHDDGAEPKTPGDTSGQMGTEGDTSPSVPGCPVPHARTREEEKRREENKTKASPSSSPAKAGDPGQHRKDVLALTHLLAEQMLTNDPKAKVSPDSVSWCRDMRLLLDRDDRDQADVERVIRWCQQHHFWKSNVLSPSKLREQFPRLWQQMTTPVAPAPYGTGREHPADVRHRELEDLKHQLEGSRAA